MLSAVRSVECHCGEWRHDTHHNDTQYNDTQHNNAQPSC